MEVRHLIGRNYVLHSENNVKQFKADYTGIYGVDCKLTSVEVKFIKHEVGDDIKKIPYCVKDSFLLTDRYIKKSLMRLGFTQKEMKENPRLIEIKRTQLLSNRIKKLQNGKK